MQPQQRVETSLKLARKIDVGVMVEGPMAQAPMLRLFGRPELVGADGQPIKFRTRKQLALLVYLALEPADRGIPRDVLVDLLWPRVPAEQGRHSLSQALTTLRHRLGETAVGRGRHVVRFTASIVTDLDRLRARVELPRHLDHPLRDLERCAGPDFAHWVEGARARCRHAAREALLGWLNEARSTGSFAAVHERATALYRVDPLCDPAVHALAERSLLDGDVTGAVRLLRTHLGRVERALGTHPPRDLSRLLRRLESGTYRTESFASLNGASHPRREVFVGREPELAALESAWVEARGGRLVTRLVVGPAGIGKSSLLRRFATSVAARTWPVFTVVCQEIGRNIPFAAVSDLVYALVKDPAVSGTEPMWLAEASRVVPGLKEIYPGIPEPAPAPPESVRVRVAEAVMHMLRSAADGGPLLLVLDDVQHLDPASREIIHLVCRRLKRTQVLQIGAMRPEGCRQAEPPNDTAVSDQWESTVELSPFSKAQIRSLLGALAGDDFQVPDGVAERVATLADGNPYVVELLLADWRRYGDQSIVKADRQSAELNTHWHPSHAIQHAFGRHYDGMSADAVAFLELLAVAARALSETDIAGLLAADARRTRTAIVELLDTGVVRLDSGALVIKNELHRAAIYYRIPEARRKYVHGQIAEFLAGVHTGNFQRKIEAVHHFLSCDLPHRAVDVGVSAADEAIGKGAPSEAESLLKILLRTPAGKTPVVQLLHATSLYQQGRYAATLASLTDLPEDELSLDQRARVSLMRAKAAISTGMGSRFALLGSIKEALDSASAIGNDEHLVRVLQLQAEEAAANSDSPRIQDVAVRATLLSRSTQSVRARALALLATAYCAILLGRLDDATLGFEKCASMLRELDMDYDLQRALNGLGISHTNGGFLERGRRAYTASLAIAERHGDDSLCSVVTNNLGVSYEDEGRIGDAIEYYRRALTHAVRAGSLRQRVVGIANIAGAFLYLGELELANDLTYTVCRAADKTADLELWIRTALMAVEIDLALLRSVVAWNRFGEILDRIGERTLISAGSGTFVRLYHHFLYETSGFQSAHRQAREFAYRGLDTRYSNAIEMILFNEWVERREGINKGSPPMGLRLVRQRGIFGAVARLVAVHVYPPGVPERQPGESSAQLLARAFPDQDFGRTPEPVLDSGLVDELKRSV